MTQIVALGDGSRGRSPVSRRMRLAASFRPGQRPSAGARDPPLPTWINPSALPLDQRRGMMHQVTDTGYGPSPQP
ncbi:MAG: hypothetical protein ACLP7Q_03835 [Isosphaeraceae bacterium]